MIMQIAIQARGFSLTDALEKHVNNRLGFALSRVTSRLRRVTVRLSDLNGPRGGIDKRCLIQVHLDGLPDVVVEDVQPNVYTAINRAAGRAARTIMRRLSLHNTRRRHHAARLAHHLSPGL
jgi:ribosome-associated translation inhibitor RaiA